ncbi:subtilisin-like protein [Aspergillus ellipticus CBS 707.79]|uniref:Subtilisin-like protein n=1 Tax=Aspergillus ellipticus CBS 707.79 TaxID=1448320 RepID=A0A319CTP5_9EURO|nr:subtilisin-like protein [Aspergillus ellipticus CBS 707.79]
MTSLSNISALSIRRRRQVLKHDGKPTQHRLKPHSTAAHLCTVSSIHEIRVPTAVDCSREQLRSLNTPRRPLTAGADTILADDHPSKKVCRGLGFAGTGQPITATSASEAIGNDVGGQSLEYLEEPPNRQDMHVASASSDVANHQPRERSTSSEKCLVDVSGSEARDTRLAEDWIRRLAMTPLVQRTIEGFRDSSCPRIKIAILDTGCDAQCSFFLNLTRQQRLTKWKDFVEGSDQPVDANGHGTDVTALAMMIAPAADIYVARVCRSPQGLGESTLQVKQNSMLIWVRAIEWAAREGADVVSMSFDFPTDNDNLLASTIHTVVGLRKCRILFFVAAGEGGCNTMPGRLARHDSVLPICATNHEGEFWGGNPSLEVLHKSVFGTLGMDLLRVSFGKGDDDGDPLNGTSCATAIATKEGMQAVLRELCRSEGNGKGPEEGKEEGKYYLYPHNAFRCYSNGVFNGLLLLTMARTLS